MRSTTRSGGCSTSASPGPSRAPSRCCLAPGWQQQRCSAPLALLAGSQLVAHQCLQGSSLAHHGPGHAPLCQSAGKQWLWQRKQRPAAELHELPEGLPEEAGAPTQLDTSAMTRRQNLEGTAASRGSDVGQPDRTQLPPLTRSQRAEHPTRTGPLQLRLHAHAGGARGVPPTRAPGAGTAAASSTPGVPTPPCGPEPRAAAPSRGRAGAQTHLDRVGSQGCALARVMVVRNRAMTTRQSLESISQRWLREAGSLPPGNGPDQGLWEVRSCVQASLAAHCHVSHTIAGRERSQQSPGESLPTLQRPQAQRAVRAACCLARGQGRPELGSYTMRSSILSINLGSRARCVSGTPGSL